MKQLSTEFGELCRFGLRAGFALTLMVLGGGFLPARAAEDSESGPHEQGRLLTQRAAGVLSSNLLAALTQGGPTKALKFCSTHAAALTAASGTNGISLRRVSHRPRNLGNRATTDELVVLEQFRARLLPGAGLPPQLRTNANGTISFFSPIVLNTPLCLNCHGQAGTEVAPGTVEAIQRLYPHDEATGFKLGDLRGMWRVDFGPASR